MITASFKAEKTLTKDTVPVDVDAVLFWKVLDPKKAALEDAMSMQAQAERERQARVIPGDSERQVAEKFGEAAGSVQTKRRKASPENKNDFNERLVLSRPDITLPCPATSGSGYRAQAGVNRAGIREDAHYANGPR